MACAKPMIMSNFQYWKETFGESSLYVDPTNSEAIATTIQELMNNETLRTNMSKQNLKHLKMSIIGLKRAENLLICIRN